MKGPGLRDAPGEGVPLDQRFLFRRRELRDLAALAEDCSRVLATNGNAFETIVDPALLDPADGGSRSRGFESWLAVAEIMVEPRSATVPVATLASSLEAHGCGSRRWGHDEVRAMMPLLERVLVDRGPRHEQGLDIDPVRNRSADLTERELMCMLSAAFQRGRRTVRLATVPEFWTGDWCESTALARAVTGEGIAMQIIRHNLEAGP
jgi:hypothetical protein